MVNPCDGLVFTDVGAWEFIAELLEADHPIEIVKLAKPQGRTAFVMKVEMGNEYPRLYIKLQAGSGQVLGRSFHYSEHGRGVRKDENEQ
ncbi:MAG TPA: hypothetical protein VGK99_04895 [Acidobacteriota bacterium]